MKRAYLYIGVVMLTMITLSAAYYFSYKKTLERYKSETISADKEEATPEPEKAVTEVTQVDTIKEETISRGTNYVLVTYDVAKDTYKEFKNSVPPEWIGLNREELTAYLSDYMNNLTLEETKKGLLAYELQTFSNQLVTLQKTYDSSLMPYEYYMSVVNYEVVVYYCDKKTIFEYTGIDARTLPNEEITKLVRGVYVTDKEELYGILENYSS